MTLEGTDPPTTTAFRVATWNMNHWQQPSDRRAGGWDWLQNARGLDLALLQETVPPPSISRNSVIYREIAGRRPWGSAVVALGAGVEVEEIWSVSGRSQYRHRVAMTHPGSVAIARVHVPRVAPITAVSLYNVLDGSPTANLLRITADLVPLLDSVDGDRVILGGDFNVYGAVATGRRTRAAAIFGLLESLGLHPVGSLAVPRPAASPDCPCGSGGTCGHIPTWKGLDLDHFFVTASLQSQVSSLAVDQEVVDGCLSDHAALVLDLALSAVPVARPWDTDSFVTEIRTRFGEARAAVVQDLIDWAARKEDALRTAGIRDRQLTDFELPSAIDPALFARISFFDRQFNPQWLFSIHAASGELQVSFQWMHHPPFNTRVGQEVIRTSLNEIESVDIAPERLGGRPRIPLVVFENPESLRRLTALLDRIVEETQPQAGTAALSPETDGKEIMGER